MFEKQINRGVDWLDANEPNWIDRIDLDTLKLKWCTQCICGQVFGDYSNVVEAIAWDAGMSRDEAGDHYGFMVPTRQNGSVARERDWDRLQAEWTKRIIEIRAMDIGEEERTIKVEPIKTPIPDKVPEPAKEPVTIPRKEPAEAPERTPVKVPEKAR